MKLKPKDKKVTKPAAATDVANGNAEEINTTQDLKNFLSNVRDRLREQSAAAIFALSALNYAMSHPKIYELLDNENKELARDVFLRLKQSGLQVKSPPMLFGADEALPVAGV